MNKLFLILAILFLFKFSFGQRSAELDCFDKINLKLPQASLLSKYGVTRIDAIDCYKTDTIEFVDSWIISTNGQIIRHDLIDTQDSLPDYTSYEYKDNKLIKIIDVAIWNTRDIIDTVKTQINYDNHGRFIYSKTTGKFTYDIRRHFLNNSTFFDLKTSMIDKNFNVFDTTFYNASGNPIRQVNSNDPILTLWKYNNTGKLIEKRITNKSDTNSVYEKWLLTYSNNRLISEEFYQSDYKSIDRIYKSEYKYTYDERGFPIKIERQNENGVFVTETILKYY